MTSPQLHTLCDIFSPRITVETKFMGYRIVVEKFPSDFDYEIFVQDPIYGKWHVWHSDEGFESEAEAIKEAKSYIDNWEPGDEYYEQ